MHLLAYILNYVACSHQTNPVYGQNINWDIDHAPEKYPKWYHSAHLAKKILDASNPAVRFQKPDTVQFTRARIQLAIRVCLDGVLSDCVFPLETEPKKCGHVWLNMGTEWDKRRIDAFAGLSPELMHHFVKITHLSGRRLKRPDSVIIPITGHEIENVLDTMWQWTPIASTIHTTSEALLKACRESLNEEGKVASAAAVTELTAASYLAAAQIYLHCRLFRYVGASQSVWQTNDLLSPTIGDRGDIR